jgi:hypothetical protein
MIHEEYSTLSQMNKYMLGIGTANTETTKEPKGNTRNTHFT